MKKYEQAALIGNAINLLEMLKVSMEKKEDPSELQDACNELFHWAVDKLDYGGGHVSEMATFIIGERSIVDAQYKRLKEDNARLQEKIQTIGREEAGLDSLRKSTLRAIVEWAQTTLDMPSSGVEDLAEFIKDEFWIRQGQYDMALEQLGNLKGYQSALKNEADNLRRERDDLKKSFTEVTVTLTDLQEENDELKANNTGDSMYAEELKKRIHQLESKNTELLFLVDKLTKYNDRLTIEEDKDE